jgi:D-sedoheptulose 7-phosphate isomerase
LSSQYNAATSRDMPLRTGKPDGPVPRAAETVSYVTSYLKEVTAIAAALDREAIGRIVEGLIKLRAAGGRLFFLGVGGSAANASHAVNDFRKIAGIESYAPTDNVAELTARVNDEGWDSSYARWLAGSRLARGDAVFVLSVGGGDPDRNVSANLVQALRLAKRRGARIYGIVGRDGGYAAQVADACVIVPTVNPATVTPHSEAFQAVVWHLIVSHPALIVHEMKWESIR